MVKNKVTIWREQKGISKAALARRIGVSRSYVTRLEQGDIGPSADVMFRIARYFKCGIDDVFQWVETEDKTERNPPGAPPCVKCDVRTFTSAAAKPVRNQSATLPARPAVMERVTDKSLVNPTAEAVASPVA